ncbi:MAG: HEAT repeat domain-containing protein, partial [Thermoanaerobaculia bacterium]
LRTALPPEGEVRLDGELKIGARGYRWKRHEVEDPRGIVDLGEALGGGDGVGAYLYAEVAVEEDTDGVLKIGSDDQVACFLNGERVHEFDGERGLTVDQDSVPVKLKQGRNRLLLKLVNRSGGWQGCLRVTSKDGKPLGAVRH